MNNIICCKWGTLYGPEFVNRLYAMVYRNLTEPFRFVCLTDNTIDIREEVETFPIEPQFKGWWSKIQYFKSPLYDLKGPTLALDLDLIIVENIDCFFKYNPERFCMREDFPGYGYSSCVMRFNAGEHPHIYNKFNAKKLDVYIHAGDHGFISGGSRKKYWGDQIWISEHANNVVLWPHEWVTKHHRWVRGKEKGKIIMWTGYKKDQRMCYDQIKHIWYD